MQNINSVNNPPGEAMHAIYLVGGWTVALEILEEAAESSNRATHVTVLGAGVNIFYGEDSNVPELAISLDLLRAGVQYIETLSNGKHQQQGEGRP